MRDIGEAIQALHAINIAHRDVKVSQDLQQQTSRVKCWYSVATLNATLSYLYFSLRTSCTQQNEQMQC